MFYCCIAGKSEWLFLKCVTEAQLLRTFTLFPLSWMLAVIISDRTQVSADALASDERFLGRLVLIWLDIQGEKGGRGYSYTQHVQL